MSWKRSAPLLVAGLALLANLLLPRIGSCQFRPPRSLEQLPQPQGTAPEREFSGPGAQIIATSTQRINRDRVEIRVFQNGKPVELFPHFHELVAATPASRQQELDQLVGASVTLVPSEKQADQWDLFTGVGGVSARPTAGARVKAQQWDIFTGVGGVGEMVLADNIFKVRQVLLSSRKNPIEIHVDGQVHRLKPGQALLVL